MLDRAIVLPATLLLFYCYYFIYIFDSPTNCVLITNRLPVSGVSARQFTNLLAHYTPDRMMGAEWDWMWINRCKGGGRIRKLLRRVTFRSLDTVIVGWHSAYLIISSQRQAALSGSEFVGARIGNKQKWNSESVGNCGGGRGWGGVEGGGRCKGRTRTIISHLLI